MIQHQYEQSHSSTLRVFHLHIRTIDSVRASEIEWVGWRLVEQIKSCILWKKKHEMLRIQK